MKLPNMVNPKEQHMQNCFKIYYSKVNAGKILGLASQKKQKDLLVVTGKKGYLFTIILWENWR